ncbi:MAG TPA: MBL fold metallo-hydrolase [Thermoanaerobaculia bacterium]|jgi:glyoxylase-like metal-dependent hydrolase (beta-lactamase superfamily II)
MRRTLRAAVSGAAASAAVIFAAPAAEFPAERMFRVVEAGPGVVSFIAAETSGPIPSGNVTAVIGEDGVLVVDSGRFPTLAKRMIAEIEKRTDKPVRYLVHTHWHLDHIAADGEFRKAFPDAVFVATDFTRRKMIEKQAAYLRDVEKNNAGYVEQLDAFLAGGKKGNGQPLTDDDRRYLNGEIADIRLEAADLAGAALVEPRLTFDRTLTVHLGKREVRVEFLGAGNTAGDAIAYVPDAKVAIVGDLLVAPTPYGYGCHPASWIETLGRLRKIDAAAVVPGHGPVMRDWSYAAKVQALLEDIRRQVGEAVRSGATLDETRKRVDVARFEAEFAGDDFARRKAFRDFFVSSAVERAYQEAKGELTEE